MFESAHAQFMAILTIAVVALLAAPTLVYLFEWRRPKPEQPRPRMPARPELQPT